MLSSSHVSRIASQYGGILSKLIRYWNKLEILQKKILIIITFSDWMPTQDHCFVNTEYILNNYTRMLHQFTCLNILIFSHRMTLF